MPREWLDTGVVVFEVPDLAEEDDTKKGARALPIYPVEFNRSYVSDHNELVIPSPDGNPAHQRIIYVLSHMIDGKSRQLAIYEILPSTGVLLTYGPSELNGDNRVAGNVVQPHIFAIEVQRPPQPPYYQPQPPEYQPRVMVVKERLDKSAWTLQMLWPDLPIFWRRWLPGE